MLIALLGSILFPGWPSRAAELSNVDIGVNAAGASTLQIPITIASFTDPEITIDGRLDEPVWSSLPYHDNMSVVEPDTLIASRYPTRAFFFYTQEGFYVGVQATQPLDSLVRRLSSRDKDVNRDGIEFYLDPTGEGLYGYFFGVHLGGSLTDGTFLPERQLSKLWDGPWYGAASETEDGYSIEMFLPWSMMAMPENIDVREMAFAITRRVAKLDETWGWPALPDSKPKFVSGFQPMLLKNVEPSRQLIFYPFTSVTRDRSDDQTRYKVGADVFWRPSTNLQLTATINPDFGAIESDDVILNLTAFETFFPEKRLFFLEGNDIFVTSPRSVIRGTPGSGAGARTVPNSFFLQPTTLVNTRRIGGPARAPEIPTGVDIPEVELGQLTELTGAGKVTGQKGDFRYGVLTAFEQDTKFHGTDSDGSPVRLTQDGRDFAVVRLLYEPNVNGRRAIGMISTLTSHPEQDAITHGIDYHYQSGNSRVIGDAQLLYSDVDGTQGAGGYFDVNYIPRQGTLHRFSFDYLDDKLDINDLGFIRRNDVITYRYSYNRTNSNSPRFRQTTNGLTFSHETNTDGRIVRSSIYYRNTLTFQNSNQFTSTGIWRPDQWDDRTSEGNGDYRTEGGGIVEFTYGTDTAEVLSASVGTSIMTEQLGGLTYTVKGGITYKPTDRVSFDIDFIYRRTDEWLIHLDGRTLATYDAKHWQPSIAVDVFLTAKQQLRFSMQWLGIQANAVDLYQVPLGDGDLIQITDGINEPTYDFTISRLTTQLRYRWEIAPLSDLFVVYTRGSNLPNRQDDSFSNLFRDAMTSPVFDSFVIKLRYRISP